MRSATSSDSIVRADKEDVAARQLLYEFSKAHTRLNNYLERGIVPDDLKQGSQRFLLQLVRQFLTAAVFAR